MDRKPPRALFRPFRVAAGLGLLLAAATLSPAAAGAFDTLFGSPTSLPPSAATEPLRTPTTYRSENGRLDVTLDARPTSVKLGPFTIHGAAYNGEYGGPVLRVKPGDVLHVHLINHLDQATNIHFHGLEVSPQGHGDNAMLMVAPGKAWDYVIAIPKTHPPGLYWYHTHAHGFAERQLMAGLSGALVIEGLQDEVPQTRAMTERLLALKEFQPDKNGDLTRVLKTYNVDIETLNGQLMPRIDIKPGETQLWRLSDQTADTFFRLSLEGHQFTVIGRNSHTLAHAETDREVFMGPADRADVLVTGGPPGSYKLVSEETETGPAGDHFPAQNLALVVSAGAPEPPAPPLSLVADTKPISGDRIDARRLVSFSEDPVTGLFFINHNTFDHDRVDVKVPLGNIEEWTIRNSSEELHIFHIHQVAFQVLSINGKPQPFDGLTDDVSIPIHGEVKIRIAFTDPAIVGRFMFHCHILEHEDKGMMAQIEVYDPKVGPLPDGPMDMSGMDMSGVDAPHGQ